MQSWAEVPTFYSLSGNRDDKIRFPLFVCSKQSGNKTACACGEERTCHHHHHIKGCIYTYGRSSIRAKRAYENVSVIWYTVVISEETIHGIANLMIVGPTAPFVSISCRFILLADDINILPLIEKNSSAVYYINSARTHFPQQDLNKAGVMLSPAAVKLRG